MDHFLPCDDDDDDDDDAIWINDRLINPNFFLFFSIVCKSDPEIVDCFFYNFMVSRMLL